MLHLFAFAGDTSSSVMYSLFSSVPNVNDHTFSEGHLATNMIDLTEVSEVLVRKPVCLGFTLYMYV